MMTNRQGWEICDKLVRELEEKVDDLRYIADLGKENAEKCGQWKYSWGVEPCCHICSECGQRCDFDEEKENYEYCPHCGVKMMPQGVRR